MNMKLSAGEKAFLAVNYFVLGLIALLTIYPFVYVLSASISAPEHVVTGKVLLWPKEITFSAYEKILTSRGIWIAYGNTVFYTVAGAAVSLLFTVCGAYPLSKKRLFGVGALSFIIALTMWINMSGPAGMIPFFLNLRDMHLLNSRFGIIIAFAVTTFYVFLLRTFFTNVPEELEEAAKIYGANDLVILWRIYLPLSVPALVTVGLFYAVQRWNGYFWAMVLLKDANKVPLQVLLKKMIVELQVNEFMEGMNSTLAYSQETIVYATIIVSIVPMLVVYPYIQKYFVHGIMIGAIKE